MRWQLALAGALVACGSSPPPPAPPPAPAVAPPPAAIRAPEPTRDEIVAAHHKLEDEQQTALAASCDKAAAPAPRCTPSCYAPEPADRRAGKKRAGAVEVQHLICDVDGAMVFSDELDAKLALKPSRRVPRAHKAGTWQGDLEAAIAVPKGDAIRVTGGWKQHAKHRCVAVSHFTRLRKAVDACGADGAFACEAAGDPAAHGINVVHFRLAEARALQSAGKLDDCQAAALEAIAVARGLPRWRQYAELNVGAHAKHASYRTRFDGTLDEDALFTAAAGLGAQAEQVFESCGGASPKTTATQEQSFHTCW